MAQVRDTKYIQHVMERAEHIYWRQQDGRQGISIRQQIVTLCFQTSILRMTDINGAGRLSWSSSPQRWGGPHTGTWT